MATVLFAACSSDDDMNSTNATVSFTESVYEFQESAGMVNIPIKVDGERNGDIRVKVKVTDGSAIAEGHYLVTSEVINIPADSEDATFNVEVIVMDDGNTENDDRDFTIAIENVEGATATGNANCSIILKDVDKNPYFKLFGDWTLTAIDVYSGETVNFDVNVSDTDGYDSYAEEYLVFKGFDEGGYNADVYWVVAYNKNGTLKIVPNGLFYAAYNFGSFIGACAVWPMAIEGNSVVEANAAVEGTFNETFDEITFDENGIAGVSVHLYDTSTGAIGEFVGTMSALAGIKLVKK